jgi:hypothetical protein
MAFRPKFMATTLAGVPHRDVEQACHLMRHNFPEATPVPILTRSLRMWIEGMPCLNIDRERRQVSFELSGRENELTEFYEKYLSQDLDYFAVHRELDASLYTLADMFRKQPWKELRFIQFHVPGIYSLSTNIRDENDIPAFHHDTLRDVMVKTLAMKAKWRKRKIEELVPGIQAMVNFGNGGLGLFVSAAGTGSWDLIKDLYNEQIEAVETITQIHCCANFDWSLLMETNTDCINFDAYLYGETMSLYPIELGRFLERGGMISWGIVPTTANGEDILRETPRSLVERLEGHLQSVVNSGIDTELLLESSWITPSCMPQTLPIELAEEVLVYTREVSQMMREKYFG